MKRPSVISGIFCAALLTAVAIPLGFWLSLMVSGVKSVYLLVAFLAWGYVLYLLCGRRRRGGQLVIIAGSFAVLIAFALWSSFAALVLTSVFLVWLIRSLGSYGSIISALLDGILCLFALGTSAWAFRATGSMVVAIWCFFLVQALYVFIPRTISAKGVGLATAEADTLFSRAHRSAEQALQRIIEGSAA